MKKYVRVRSDSIDKVHLLAMQIAEINTAINLYLTCNFKSSVVIINLFVIFKIAQKDSEMVKQIMGRSVLEGGLIYAMGQKLEEIQKEIQLVSGGEKRKKKKLNKKNNVRF